MSMALSRRVDRGEERVTRATSSDDGDPRAPGGRQAFFAGTMTRRFSAADGTLAPMRASVTFGGLICAPSTWEA